MAEQEEVDKKTCFYCPRSGDEILFIKREINGKLVLFCPSCDKYLFQEQE